MENKLSKSELIQAPRGTKDILPEEAAKWRNVERAVDDVAALFGYGEIRTPTFEQLRLFKRAVGEETDIVSKEMFLLQSKSDEEEYALRPELTAPVVRMAIEHGLLTGQSDCLRLYYNRAANFRYEKPQLGRFRQFHQFGTELLGVAGSQADAETISFAIAVYREIGLTNFRVRLNSLGSSASRERWKESLVPYLERQADQLSDDSKRRTSTNPLRVLDSKAPEDQEVIRNAPKILDYLDDADLKNFTEFQTTLTTEGIEYTVDPLLVRGIDYYTRTVFEVTSTDLGSQDALCGGGRYDGLIEQLGGPPTPAVGFGAGIERALLVLEKLNASFSMQLKPDVYVIAQAASARETAFHSVSILRASGTPAMGDLNARSFKAQMREANKMGAKFAYIIGETELAEGAGILKNMQSGEQEKVPFGAIVDRITSPNS